MRLSMRLSLLALLLHVALGFSSHLFVNEPSFRSQRQRSVHCRITGSTTIMTKDPAARVPPIARGGASGALRSSILTDDDAVPKSMGAIVASLWGVVGVLYILAKAIVRVMPIALAPFDGLLPLSQLEMGCYIATCVWFAYVEGYKGFQKKFAPLVVRRSFTLHADSPYHHLILAPLYSMGLFHATRKRIITSWSVTLGVAAIVAAVKRVAYPWRNIIDAGVVAGLTWGSISIVYFYVRSYVSGKMPTEVDPALPDPEKKVA